MSVLQEYKCPCCGGAIEFDSQSQKMKCPYCDTEFDVETLKNYDGGVSSNSPGLGVKIAIELNQFTFELFTDFGLTKNNPKAFFAGMLVFPLRSAVFELCQNFASIITFCSLGLIFKEGNIDDGAAFVKYFN